MAWLAISAGNNPQAVGCVWGHVHVRVCVGAAGHLPKEADGKMHSGKVGRDLTTEEAYKLARLVAINLIATVKGA